MTFKMALKTFRFLLQDYCELRDEKMKEKNKDSQLTLFAHGASSPSRTFAAELSTLVLAGTAVQAGMRAAGILRFVVGLGAAVGYGAGQGQRVGGDGRHGGNGGGGGGRSRVWSRGRRFTPAIERPARGAWRAPGDEGGGCLRSCVSGGGGGSRCRDGCCGGGSCGE